MSVRAMLLRFALALAIMAATIWLVFQRERFDAALIAHMLLELGAWAPIAFVASYALATVLFVPGALFSLAGGALFGPLWGTLLNLTGATLGAASAFLVARYLAADWVRRTAGARLARLIAGVDTEGWRFVAFVRLVPLFPFNVLNYALGLTRIPMLHYILASLVCMAPGALAYSWIGYAGRQALAGDAAALRHGLLALGLFATVAYVPRLARRLRGSGHPQWIEADDLRALLDQARAIAVIDVRGPEEFRGPLGHIAAATNMPLADLPRRLHELDRRQRVVIVCRTDKRSAKAEALLIDAGFADVRVLHGGMERWNQAGHPASNHTLSAGA